MTNRKLARENLLREIEDLWTETRVRMESLTQAASSFPISLPKDDPDLDLVTAASDILCRTDVFLTSLTAARKRAERPVVFLVDYSGSMADDQLNRAYNIIRERMLRTPVHCGAIGFDSRPSVMVQLLPGPIAAKFLRHPKEVRNEANGVNGGGGTDARSTVEFCDTTFAGDRGPVRKVAVTDGQMSPEDLALFDEVIVVPYEEKAGEPAAQPATTSL